jgi:hypothetical protein
MSRSTLRGRIRVYVVSLALLASALGFAVAARDAERPPLDDVVVSAARH